MPPALNKPALPILDLSGAIVVGAGPAGLAAAETISETGQAVLLADAMPSPGRKFLMAGKSGLNLTKDEAPDRFRAALSSDGTLPEALCAALEAFGPQDAVAWARGLGQELFTGSTGRVFPTAWKASPLLRAWLARLGGRGVDLRLRWRWIGFDGEASRFDTPEGPRLVRSPATVLSLGGASWRRLGSDGAWAEAFPGRIAPFAPSNMGLVVRWSPHMERHLGQPVKSAAWTAGPLVSRGEVVVSSKGLEGGDSTPCRAPCATGCR